MFQARGTHGFDVYMVMDLMETDLHKIIHSKQPLTEQHLQYFLYQIFRGLKYIHSAGVIHRDLKPSNLLINADCLLKIGDFGMARSLSQGPEGQSSFMTQYVATRWYRAPELLFSMLDYSAAMDIWSVGCIFAEMIMRRQLFPGKDHMSQLKLVIYYLGTPSQEVMDRISSDLIKRIIAGLGYKEPLPWSGILSKATPEALDLVQKMMYLEPWLRISASDALEHPYLALFHDSETEPVCSKQVVLETDSLESMSPDELKAALADHASKYSSFQDQNSFKSAPKIVEKPTKKPEHLVESPDFLAGLDDDVTNLDDDVIMLSAKLEETTLKGSRKNNQGLPDSQDAKAKLRNALQAKAAAGAAVKPAAEPCTVTATAHARHKERVEKRRRRSEKQAANKSEQVPAQHKLSNEDQSLLERWKRMQKETEIKKFEGQIGDIISETLPSPMTAESSRNFREMSAENRNPTEDRSSSVRGGKQLDSAQLMDTWLQATNMDPEELQDLEKEIRMVTPIE